MDKSAFLRAASAALLIAAASISAVETRQKEIHFPDGRVKERYGYYLDDKKHEIRDGLDEEFFSNGAKKGELHWRAGKEDGPVVYYFQDGRKSYEANYREGKKNGFATVWYQSGQKQWQTVFREGMTNGVWREWFPDGKKKFEANYSDGKLDGLATWWYDNGHIWQERSFQTGQQIKGSVREWDRNGKQTYPPVDGTNYGDDMPEPPHRDSTAGGANVNSNANPNAGQ